MTSGGLAAYRENPISISERSSRENLRDRNTPAGITLSTNRSLQFIISNICVTLINSFTTEKTHARAIESVLTKIPKYLAQILTDPDPTVGPFSDVSFVNIKNSSRCPDLASAFYAITIFLPAQDDEKRNVGVVRL